MQGVKVYIGQNAYFSIAQKKSTYAKWQFVMSRLKLRRAFLCSSYRTGGTKSASQSSQFVTLLTASLLNYCYCLTGIYLMELIRLLRTGFLSGSLFLVNWPNITKTCLYNFDPRKPHFYIVKLGFAGVYIIFVISAENIDSGYSLEPPHRGGSNEYPQCMFWAEIWKISEYFIWNFSFFWW